MNTLERTLIEKAGYLDGCVHVGESMPERVVMYSARHMAEAHITPSVKPIIWQVIFPKGQPTSELARSLPEQHTGGDSFQAACEGSLWCAARHSIGYTTLPDWFVAFDVYDPKSGRFWSTRRRNALVGELGMKSVPALFTGTASLISLKKLLSSQSSAFTASPMEGIIIRRENQDWLLGRAKLVRSEFTQAIDEHWSRREVEWNRLSASIAPSQT